MKKLLLVVLFTSTVLAAQLPTGTISGRILSRGGQPAAGVRVSAMSVPEPGVQVSNATALVGISMTDSEGRYRLENIPPGRYYVVAGLVDFPTYYPGGLSTSAATTLNVLSGVPITGIDFTLAISASVTVSGRLVQPNGAPATGVPSINLIGRQPGITTSSVRSDGSFEFSRVRPGNYQLLLVGVPFAERIPVVVGDEDVTGIEVPVVGTVNLTGTVNVEENGPRPRLTIVFSPVKGNRNIPGATPQTNGTFQVTLPEGEYRVGWTGLPAGYELKSITAGSVDLLSTTLKASSSSPVPSIVVNLGVGKDPWVKVSGKVTALPPVQNGTPYRLTLSGPPFVDFPEVPINPDGSFGFARLLPGTYSARITPALPVAATTFTVGNRDVTDVAIALQPLKEIRGVITNGNVSGMLRFSWNESSGPNTTATASQIDGKFTLLVPEGERRITLDMPGYTVQSFTYGSVDLLKEPLRVSFSDVEEFRITLTPGPDVVEFRIIISHGGVIDDGSDLARIGRRPPPPPPPPPPPTPATTRIGGDVAQANLISSVPPAYPPFARAAQVQGVVLLQAQISKDGAVEDLRVISGHPLLTDAALKAVRQWRYRPQMLNGQAIPVMTTITVDFTML
jgi:TonB family protein